MNWFYAKDGQPAGPVDEQEFARLIASGTVSDTTLVWRSGLPEWKPYAAIRTDAPQVIPPAAEEELASTVTEPERSPAAVASAPTAHTIEEPPYAGFWIRVGAAILDGLILLPVFTVVYLGFLVASPSFLANDPDGAHVRIIFELVVLTLAGGYQTLFVGKFGATPGKMVCDLRVVSPAGSRISYGRALGRYFCKGLSGIFFGAGFVIVALNRQKCALHDFVCETRVIHTD